jgi:hypothetical protein
MTSGAHGVTYTANKPTVWLPVHFRPVPCHAQADELSDEPSLRVGGGEGWASDAAVLSFGSWFAAHCSLARSWLRKRSQAPREGAAIVPVQLFKGSASAIGHQTDRPHRMGETTDRGG